MEEMKNAKMHYDALMASLNKMGMSMDEFEDKLEGESEGEEGMEQESDMEEEAPEGMGKAHGKPMDRAKIAVVVARMKNKMKE